MRPPHDAHGVQRARVHASLERCLGKLALVESSLAELAASDKGLPRGLAAALRRHNANEARRELHAIGALIGRILAPVEDPFAVAHGSTASQFEQEG